MSSYTACVEIPIARKTKEKQGKEKQGKTREGNAKKNKRDEMFGRKRKKEPMTALRFVCVLFPKLFMIVSVLVYLIGGTVLFMADESAWQAAITPWGIIEVVLLLMFAAWLGIGKIYLNHKKDEDAEK